jgi:hypothetical protein
VVSATFSCIKNIYKLDQRSHKVVVGSFRGWLFLTGTCSTRSISAAINKKTYKKKQWRPSSKKKKRRKNLSNK